MRKRFLKLLLPLFIATAVFPSRLWSDSAEPSSVRVKLTSEAKSSHSNGQPDSVEPPAVKAGLISEIKSVQPGRLFWIAVRLQIENEWHVYWKNPGDSGLATSVEWKLPDGFKAGTLVWPYPQKFSVPPPLVTFGYENEVLLLSQIEPPKSLNAAEPQIIKAGVDWLACREICVPGHADLSLELPVVDTPPEINQAVHPKFEQSRLNLPYCSNEWKLSARVRGKNILLSLVPPAWFHGKFSNAEFFPNAPGIIDHEKNQTVKRTRDGFEIELFQAPNLTKPLDKLEGILVNDEGWDSEKTRHALAVNVPVEKPKGIFNQLLNLWEKRK